MVGGNPSRRKAGGDSMPGAEPSGHHSRGHDDGYRSEQRRVSYEIHRKSRAPASRARVDADVLEWLKSQGKSYQSRIIAILRRELLASPKV
jgi:uncharacterized protein (DUF4415 family)